MVALRTSDTATTSCFANDLIIRTLRPGVLREVAAVFAPRVPVACITGGVYSVVRGAPRRRRSRLLSYSGGPAAHET